MHPIRTSYKFLNEIFTNLVKNLIHIFKYFISFTFKKAAAVQEPPPATGLILFRSAVGDSEMYIEIKKKILETNL